MHLPQLRRRDGGAAERGAAAVEFALVLPVLLLLVFGMLNWGVVMSQQISLNSSVRDAARAGVVTGGVGATGQTCQQVIDRTRNSVSALNFTPANLGVTVTLDGTTVCTAPAGQASASSGGSTIVCSGAAPGGGQLKVATTYTSKMLVAIIPPANFTLSAAGQFTCEYT